jgi:dihydroflavonol-4-reductase
MILVTGGAGLLGKELITQLLAQGKQVRAIYNKTPLSNFNTTSFEQMRCDILDVVALEAAMQGITQVYHCAALVSFNPRRRQELYKINVEGTANIVNAALDAGVKKIVHVSSVAALGRIREDGPVDESMNWTPETNNSRYGESKYLAELEVWRGIAEGLEAVMVNPAVILGAGNWNDGSTKIFQSVYNEFPWYTEGTTGFVDVRDVAKAMLQLMDSSISAERFIVSADTRSYKNVFDLMAKAFGKKLPYKKVSPFIAALVWRIETIKSWFTKQDPLLTRETALTAMAKVKFDNAKLLQYLPEFKYHSIEETISNACATLITKNNLQKTTYP